MAMSGMALAEVPGNPTSLANTTGNYWVNHSWTAGVNTDSYNVSINDVWHNTTTNTFYKATYTPSAWQNITVYGYNSSLNGNLSVANVSQTTQTPDKVGMDLSSITAILNQIPDILEPIPPILIALAQVAIYGAVIVLSIGIVFSLRGYIEKLLRF
jgi:hypothetical protein